MSLFDEMWRSQATPVLNAQFGETVAADYYDGAGTKRGSYQVLLGPEDALEKDEDKPAGRMSRYQRTATLLWPEAEEFAEPVIATTGRLVVTIGGEEVTYSIAGILARSDAGIVLILQRGAGQRR